jgi:hypothetical protein
MTLVRPNDELRVGGEIEAYCTKCRLMTNHRIVAFEDEKIKKVICLTCQSQHVFRLAPPKKKEKPEDTVPKAPPTSESADEAPAAKPPAKPRPARPSRADKSPAKKFLVPEADTNNKIWLERREALGSGKLIAYSIKGVYETGQALNHSTFGVGFVTRVIPPNKIEVLFESSIKILIMMESEPRYT